MNDICLQDKQEGLITDPFHTKTHFSPQISLNEKQFKFNQDKLPKM